MAANAGPLDGLENGLKWLTRYAETAARSWESDLELRSHLDLSMERPGVRLDLIDRGDTYVVLVDVPGYDRDDLEVELHGRRLTISGDRDGEPRASAADERGEFDGTALRRERRLQSFSRQLQVPAPVDTDAAEAAVATGVLMVRLPKLDSSEPTRPIDIE